MNTTITIATASLLEAVSDRIAELDSAEAVRFYSAALRRVEQIPANLAGLRQQALLAIGRDLDELEDAAARAQARREAGCWAGRSTRPIGSIEVVAKATTLVSRRATQAVVVGGPPPQTGAEAAVFAAARREAGADAAKWAVRHPAAKKNKVKQR